MKNLGSILAVGLTVLIVLGVGLFSFLPAKGSAQATVEQSDAVVPTAPIAQTTALSAPAPAQLETTMAEREATYQAQIETLNRTVQERQATYQAQMQQATAQITAAQSQLNELKAQEQNWLAQATQLETTRAERLAAYQDQLQQVQRQYNDRLAQLQAQLNEAQGKLSEATAQLGR